MPVSGDVNGQSSQGFCSSFIFPHRRLSCWHFNSMEKIIFEFGDWVETKHYVYMGYSEDQNDDLNRMLYRVENYEKLFGRISGMTYRYEGIVYTEEPSFGSYYHPEDDDPPQSYLQVRKSHRLYYIKQGMMNKPILCLPEDLTKIPKRKFSTLWQVP